MHLAGADSDALLALARSRDAALVLVALGAVGAHGRAGTVTAVVAGLALLASVALSTDGNRLAGNAGVVNAVAANTVDVLVA